MTGCTQNLARGANEIAMIANAMEGEEMLEAGMDDYVSIRDQDLIPVLQRWEHRTRQPIGICWASPSG